MRSLSHDDTFLFCMILYIYIIYIYSQGCSNAVKRILTKMDGTKHTAPQKKGIAMI